MIRLTVARYYTPSGRSIQRPYEGGDVDAYNQDFIDRRFSGELFDANSFKFPDSLKLQTLVNGRTVYGGGGIMPDYFVPVDTTSGTFLHANLNARGVINRLAITEVDNNRQELLDKYPNITSFIDSYQLPDYMMSRLRSIAEEVEIKWDDEEFEQSRHLISVQLTALIARDLYDSSAFYHIINDENDIYREGLKIITDSERYDSLLEGVGSNVGQTAQSVL